MPDDEKNEVTEQPIVSEYEKETEDAADSFDETANEPDPKFDLGKETVTDKKEKADLDVKDIPSKPEEKAIKDEKDLTAKDLLEKHIEATKDDISSSVDVQIPSSKEEPPATRHSQEQQPPKKQAPENALVFTNDEVVEILNTVSIDDLPGEIQVGDKIINLKEFAEAYPDEFDSTKMISTVIAKKLLNQALKDGDFVKASDVKKTIMELSNKLDMSLAQQQFNIGVSAKHNDFYYHIYGDGVKDFRAWLADQSEAIKVRAGSLKPKDGILIMDYYKEDIAKKKTKALDDKASVKKKKLDALYESTSQGKKGGQRDSVPDENDAEAAFEE